MADEGGIITVSNDGQLITSSNYWSSVYARKGKVFCSVNAGAIRILLPPSRWNDVSDRGTSQYCVLSRGPRPGETGPRESRSCSRTSRILPTLCI